MLRSIVFTKHALSYCFRMSFVPKPVPTFGRHALVSSPNYHFAAKIAKLAKRSAGWEPSDFGRKFIGTGARSRSTD